MSIAFRDFNWVTLWIQFNAGIPAKLYNSIKNSALNMLHDISKP